MKYYLLVDETDNEAYEMLVFQGVEDDIQGVINEIKEAWDEEDEPDWFYDYLMEKLKERYPYPTMQVIPWANDDKLYM